MSARVEREITCIGCATNEVVASWRDTTNAAEESVTSLSAIAEHAIGASSVDWGVAALIVLVVAEVFGAVDSIAAVRGGARHAAAQCFASLYTIAEAPVITDSGCCRSADPSLTGFEPIAEVGVCT